MITALVGFSCFFQPIILNSDFTFLKNSCGCSAFLPGVQEISIMHNWYTSQMGPEVFFHEFKTIFYSCPLQKPVPQNFDEQIDAVVAAAPDAFIAVRGAEIKKNLGPFAAFAKPEYESTIALEGAESAVVMQDNFNQISWIARFKSYAEEAEAQKQFSALEEKLRKHISYPFGEAKLTPVRDARGSFLYVEPKASADERYKGLMITLALMKGLENVEGKLEQRFQTTLSVSKK
jgi:hypothetical protein